jgi:hypothetical protein
MKRIIVPVLLLLATGCDPYPSIQWYNAGRGTVILRDDDLRWQIAPGRSVEAIPGRYDTPFVLTTGATTRTYQKRLPEHFGEMNMLQNKLVYRFQIEPDGKIMAIPARVALPAPSGTPQPPGFPLLPD